jgi:hypothetical protein
MAAPDLDPRSSALDELHALLKSDKISKRKVSCQIIFLWADFCLRERFSLLLLLPIFLSAQIALLTGFNHRKRKVSDIDDLRLFLFHNLIFMLKYPRGNAILTFTYRRASKSLKTISVREIFCNIWTDARMTLQLSLKT